MSIRIGWYLQEFTLGVYGMDHSIWKLQKRLDRVIHYHDHDFLLIYDMHRDFGTYTWQDSDWRKGSSMLDMMALDSGIEGFLHDMKIKMSRMIRWHIWDLGII